MEPPPVRVRGGWPEVLADAATAARESSGLPGATLVRLPPRGSTLLYCAELLDGLDGVTRLSSTLEMRGDYVEQWLIEFGADRVLVWDQTHQWWLLDDGGWELTVMCGPRSVLAEVIPDLSRTVFDWFYYDQVPPKRASTAAKVLEIVRRYDLLLEPGVQDVLEHKAQTGGDCAVEQ